MNNNNSIDELSKWINDSSKVLTKKQKKKLNETTSNTKKSKKEISKENKDKLNKYNRKSDPFYKKTLSERIQIQKEYKNMLKQEETFKNNKMNEIMELMKTMTEEQQQQYLNKLLSNKEIEV